MLQCYDERNVLNKSYLIFNLERAVKQRRQMLEVQPPGRY